MSVLAILPISGNKIRTNSSAINAYLHHTPSTACVPLIVKWICHNKHGIPPLVEFTPNLANPTNTIVIQLANGISQQNDAQTLLFTLLKTNDQLRNQRLAHLYSNTQVTERHLHNVTSWSPKPITTTVSFGCRSASCISHYGDKLKNIREERWRQEPWPNALL